MKTPFLPKNGQKSVIEPEEHDLERGGRSKSRDRDIRFDRRIGRDGIPDRQVEYSRMNHLIEGRKPGQRHRRQDIVERRTVRADGDSGHSHYGGSPHDLENRKQWIKAAIAILRRIEQNGSGRFGIERAYKTL